MIRLKILSHELSENHPIYIEYLLLINKNLYLLLINKNFVFYVGIANPLIMMLTTVWN